MSFLRDIRGIRFDWEIRKWTLVYTVLEAHQALTPFRRITNRRLIIEEMARCVTELDECHQYLRVSVPNKYSEQH